MRWVRCSCAIAVGAFAPGAQGRDGATWFGPTQLLTTEFGYAVVDGSLFAYSGRSWTNVTPPERAGFVEDVAFADRRNGWVGTYDGASARVWPMSPRVGAEQGVSGGDGCGRRVTKLSQRTSGADSGPRDSVGREGGVVAPHPGGGITIDPGRPHDPKSPASRTA